MTVSHRVQTDRFTAFKGALKERNLKAPIGQVTALPDSEFRPVN